MTWVKKRLLNNNSIEIFNNKITYWILINNVNKNVVIVQSNVTRHLINKVSIKRFTQANKWDIIIFLEKHPELKEKRGQVVEDKELLIIQDEKDKYIRPGFFYYCKGISAYLLSNIYTKLEMINRIWETIQGFIPYHQDKLSLSYHI